MKSQIKLYFWLTWSLKPKQVPAEHSPKILNKGYVIEKEDKSDRSKSLGKVSGYNSFWLVEKDPEILQVQLSKMSWFLPENFTETCFHGLCVRR